MKLKCFLTILSSGNLGSPSPKIVKSTLAFQELEARAKNAESSLADMKQNLEEIKKEKEEQVKALDQKLDKLREELNESRYKL